MTTDTVGGEGLEHACTGLEKIQREMCVRLMEWFGRNEGANGWWRLYMIGLAKQAKLDVLATINGARHASL
jgi:hypothetical protein